MTNETKVEESKAPEGKRNRFLVLFTGFAVLACIAAFYMGQAAREYDTYLCYYQTTPEQAMHNEYDGPQCIESKSTEEPVCPAVPNMEPLATPVPAQ